MKWFSRCLFSSVMFAAAVQSANVAWSDPVAVRERALDVPPAPPRPDGKEAPGRSVQLPYTLHDDQGHSWGIDQDGSISNDGGDLYDGGGHLLFDNGQAGYASNNNVASLSPRGDELVFPPMGYNGLKISRRVSVNAKGGWCRFLEVLENPTAAPVHIRLQIDFSLPNGIQASEPLTDDKQPAKPQLGIAVSGGNDAVAMIGAGRGSKVLASFVPRPDEPSVEFTYTLDVPPKKTISVVHLQVRRKTIDDAISSFSTLKEREYLKGLPSEIAKGIVNFPKAAASMEDLELLRGDLLDIVELRSGDQYKGTLKEPSWKLQTAYGPVELSADRVIAMTTSGEHRPTQMIVTADGEVFAGTLQMPGGAAAPASGIRMQLSSGQVTQIPLSSISRFGYRRRDNEPEEYTLDKPMVILTAGDRMKVELPSGEIPFITRYGTLHLTAPVIGAINFQASGHPVHEVTLTDGSRFAGLVGREHFDFKPMTVGGGRTISLPTSAISRLVCSHEPPKEDPDAPSINLSNGDLLVGTLDGKMVLDTAFDSIEVNAVEVRVARHGERPATATTVASPSELQLTLWDNATVSGRLRGDVLSCRLKSGPIVRVPVGLLNQYEQPLPHPPALAVQEIKNTVADLSASEWQKRDRAANQLIDLGPGIIGVLRDLRTDGETGEAAKRLDEVLHTLEEARKAKPAPPAQAAQPQQGEMEEKMDAPEDGAATPADDAEEVPAEGPNDANLFLRR